MPGGSFRFCLNSAPIQPTRLRKPQNEALIDRLLFCRPFVRFLCWGFLEGQFVTSHCLLNTIFFKRECALCKACLVPAAHPLRVDRKIFSEVPTPMFLSNHTARLFFSLIPFLVAVSAAAQSTPVQSFPLETSAGLEAHNIKLEPAEFLGRKAVRLTTDAQDGAGFAILAGTDFQDGIIEADLAVKITTPPGVRMPGFEGVAFRVKPDGSEYQIFYLRPKNALAEDQAMRNHSVQYCAEPGFGWYRLRREWPYAYESYADIEPETWTHLKIVVAGRMARIFLNGSAKPSLVVDGMKGSTLRGRVALWGYAGEESYFSNVRITPAPPLPVKNGSDASGTWNLKLSSDAGRFEGTMKLTRNGEKVMGTWSGDLGDGKPIAGTWRDGYVELSFPADWPAGGDGAPGPAKAFLEGWIDDASAKGRMRVENRTDGPWVAERKAP